MSPTVINRVVSNQQTYNERSSQVQKQPTPDRPGEAKEKFRWLQGTMRNATDFRLEVSGNFLDSGKFVKAPAPVDPFTLNTFEGCNGNNTFLTGVTGGACFRIDLDQDHTFYFSVGFTHPTMGGAKAGVVASNKAEDGYNAATKAGGDSVESVLYEAKDTDGNTVRFKLHIETDAGTDRPQYRITMIRFDA